jgi:hypothetical protein
MTAFLFSCENATCAIPEAYREIFAGSEEIVTSPEGWEPGALNLAQGFAIRFRTPLIHGDVTRLLIDYEVDGDARWSRFSKKLSDVIRGKIVDRHERVYRSSLIQRITEDLHRHDLVLHVSVHTIATTDGLVILETPENAPAAETLAVAWRNKIAAAEMDVRQVSGAGETVLSRSIAQKFDATRYAQIRLSVSQSFFLEGHPFRWEIVKKLLMDTLTGAEAENPSGPTIGSVA